MGAGTLIARVTPDVTGIDRSFDYLVPEQLLGVVAIGDQVRVPLHGRAVGGWVVDLAAVADHPDETEAASRLKAINTWSGHGPAADLVALSEWAAMHWTGRRRNFLSIASPERAVKQVPPRHRTTARPEPVSPATLDLLEAQRRDGSLPWVVLRIPPASDPVPVLAAAVRFGPTLVVTPSTADARLIGGRLRRTGLTVAVVPDEWSQAAAGVDIVIGARSAAWAPCPDLAVAVVLDEHDEALQSESSPTWHAREVVAERCRRAGAMTLLVSPCPSPIAVRDRRPAHPEHSREAAGWPAIEVVDLDEDERWRTSLITSPLIEVLRSRARVICVLNRTGRARLVACRSCRELMTCEKCDAAIALDDHGAVVCPRCPTTRPPICLNCRSSAMANLRAGVTRLREELEAAAGRPVAQITAQTPTDADMQCDVVVGTEAVLHRSASADVVVFLDFDAELLAPFYSAADHAIALVVRAGRIVGPRRGSGRVILQSRQIGHPIIAGLAAGDPTALETYLMHQRATLRLPPFSAIAEITGPGAPGFIDSLGSYTTPDSVDIVADRSGATLRWLIRASDAEELTELLASGSRPAGQRLRIAVDPVRL